METDICEVGFRDVWISWDFACSFSEFFKDDEFLSDEGGDLEHLSR